MAALPARLSNTNRFLVGRFLVGNTDHTTTASRCQISINGGRSVVRMPRPYQTGFANNTKESHPVFRQIRRFFSQTAHFRPFFGRQNVAWLRVLRNRRAPCYERRAPFRLERCGNEFHPLFRGMKRETKPPQRGQFTANQETPANRF